MKISKVTAAFFSPTGSTAEVVRLLAGDVSAALAAADLSGRDWISEDDFTLPGGRNAVRCFEPDELLILGTPTYAGRVPNKIAPEIARLFRGNGTPAVPVVTFGNRSFDHSLAELAAILEKNGFRPVGAAAMCTPHAFSDVLGAGRPDEKDRELLRQLAGDICRALQERDACRVPQEKDACRAPQVKDACRAPQEKDACRVPQEETYAGDVPTCLPELPGDPEAPYYTPLGLDGKPAKFLKAHPKVRPERCRHCGTCAAVCPMGSVCRDHPAEMTGICIKCQACIRRCPAEARYFDDAAFLSHVQMLEQTYGRRAASVIFTRNGRREEPGSGQAAFRKEQAAIRGMHTEEAVHRQYIFRDICAGDPSETEAALRLETVCFSPAEACTPDSMRRRIAAAPEEFLAAYSRDTGEMAGFLSGLATCETVFRDAFFTEESLHDPKGTTEMILGLNVLPAHRGRGLARALMMEYSRRAASRGRKRLVLTCHEEKIPMYSRMGFRDLGLSASVWGGSSWHDMELILQPENDSTGC